MTRPRIYLAITQFLPIVGGAERQVLAHARSLRKRGYDTTIVTIRLDRSSATHDEVQGVPVVRVGGWIAGNRERFPPPARKLAFVIAVLLTAWNLWWHRRRYDVLSIYQLNLLTLPAGLAGLAARKAIVVSPRCSGPSRTPVTAGRDASAPRSGSEAPAADSDLAVVQSLGPFFVRCLHAVLLRAQAVMVVLSARMADEMTGSGLALPDIVCIPNGVDVTRFSPLATGEVDEERDRTVICVGRLTHQKGGDVLLSAWQLVQRDISGARLIVVGGGPLEHALKGQAAELGVARSVEFIGPRDDVPEQLRRAGIFVLPSRYEGMPNVVLEAMATGLACVATRVSGSEDIIRSGETGLLVEPEDDEALAQALIALLRDPAAAKRLGQAARRTVARGYSLEQVTDRYADLYDMLAAGRTAGQDGPLDRDRASMRKADI